MSPLRILIADDHTLFNDGVKDLLASEKDLEVVGQVFSGDRVVTEVRNTAPDLLLLDINLPKVDGLAVAKCLRRDFPRVRIVALTMYAERKVVEDCDALGVEGYVLKNASKADLLEALRAVAAGGRYRDPRLERKAPPPEQDGFARRLRLTPREAEVLRLIADGLTSAQIAERLFRSVLTVETHRRNINLKLEVKSPAELMRLAIELRDSAG